MAELTAEELDTIEKNLIDDLDFLLIAKNIASDDESEEFVINPHFLQKSDEEEIKTLLAIIESNE